MSPGAGTAKKRLGVGVVAAGGFALGCGCRDAKAVAVAVAASGPASPYSAATTTTATETSTSTATTATWRGARTTTTHPSSTASASTGTLTVPSASSSSLPWEDADAEGDVEEVNCKREATVSFSGLLRQLNELEQSVVSWERKSTSKDYLSPPPPPLPARPVKQRDVHSGGGDSKEGHGNFSPQPPPASATSFQFQITQLHRKTKSMDKADRQVEAVHSKQPPPPPPPPPLPLPPEQQLKVKSTDDKGGKKDDANVFPTPQAPNHLASQELRRRRRPREAGRERGRGRGRCGGEAVRRPAERLPALHGDDLRELLRHFLALNAPRHHDAILRAFTEDLGRGVLRQDGPRPPRARRRRQDDDSAALAAQGADATAPPARPASAVVALTRTAWSPVTTYLFTTSSTNNVAGSTIRCCLSSIARNVIWPPYRESNLPHAVMQMFSGFVC
ncbi:unnamed protein product [Miscanthus lutarioriparius]|uniref:OVATE domain-containing protein n=1 Tax=Miscanthus lutarioriparius TaxID=422564 RepID=A0A811QUR2_9POAL|nr:unnamed protein product [Miscanthus lutarioriparius]